MIEMNIFIKQKQTHRHRKQIYGYQRGKGLGEGWIESLGLADTSSCIGNMQGSKRDTDVKNRLLDSVEEGEGGMVWENGAETCILPYVK